MSSPDASEKPDDVTDNTSSSGGLKENFSQQQAKITALKELVRQTEATQGKRTASAQEKAKNIAQRLTHLKSKSARAKHGDKSLTEVHEDETTTGLQTFHHAATTSTSTTIASDADDASSTTTTADNTTHEPPAAQFQRADSLPAGGGGSARRPETPGSEKIALLRRQMEQNRARMAEREHSKRDVEQLVTQLKAKFNSSQMSLDRSTSVSSGHLGRSIGDLSLEHTSTAHASNRTRHHRPTDRFQSSADLSGVAPSATSAPHNFDRERIRYLEQRCATLEEQAAQREAAFVGRNVPAEQAQRVRELDAEIIDLREQLREKDSVIEARTQAVGVVSEMGRTAEDELEDTRTEWQQSQRRFADAEQQFGEQLAAQAERIRGLEQANEILETARFELTVQRAQMEGGDGGFSTRLGELQRLNETLQRRIGELEAEKETADVEEVESSGTAELETMVTELTRRVEELTANVQCLQAENDELKSAAHERDDDDGDLGERLRTALATIERLDGELQEKCTECNVLTANCAVLQEKLKVATPKSLFSVDELSEGGDSAEATITGAGASSGDCARLKQQLDEANKAAIKTKLKTRQLQKQIDTLRKADATARQVGELTDECDALRQRVHELEELAAATAVPDSSNAAADRVQVLEATCHNQIEAIRLLEEQKCELSEDLSGARAELGELRERARDVDESERHAQVTSDLAACRQEEDLDAVRATVAELRTQIAAGQAERSVLAERLNHYVAENMELLDRWEKVGNGSSAESIEIVENLTASERLEMEEIEHQQQLQQQATSTEAAAAVLVEGQVEQEEAAGETDSSAMSQDLSDSLVRLREESSELMERIEAFTSERREVLGKMELLQADNAGLLAEVEELRVVVQELRAERSLRTDPETARPVPEVLPPSPAVEFSGELYEKSLRALEALLEGYRRGKDKNAKFDVSKKLAKEAKNNVELVQRLLGEHVELVGRVNRLQQEIAVARTEEKVAGGEVETVRALEKQLAAAQQTIEELETARSEATREINELSTEVARLQRVEQKTTELDAENTLAQKTIEQLESDRAASAQEIAELRDEVDRLQSADQNAASERTELADELTALRADLQRTQRATADAVDGLRSAEQEREILKKLVAEQKDQLIDTITEFQQTVDDQCAEIDELRAQKSKDQGHEQGVVAELNDKMIALKRLFDENNAQLERQAAELVEKRETVDTLNAQLMEVYRSGEDAAAQLAAKDDELSYVQEICEANRAEATALSAKLAASEAAGRRLEETIAEQMHAIRVIEDKAKAAAAAAASEVKPAVEASAEAATLRSQVGELEARNREQLEKLKKFAANLKKKNAQCAELGEKIAALESKESGGGGGGVELLEAELLEKTNAVHELSAEIERLQAASVDSNKYAELSEALARQTDELRQLEREKQELSTANAEIANENTRHVVTLTEQSAQLRELDERLQRSSAEFAALRAEHGTQAGELHELRVKIEKCKQIIREKNRELKRLQEQVAELQSAPAPDDSIAAELAAERQLRSADALKLAEHEHFIESLHAERAQLEAHIAQLEERLGQAAENAAEAAAESARRAEELRTLTERFDEAVRQHSDELHQQTANAEQYLQRSTAAEAAEADLANSLAEAREDLAASTDRANRAAARAETLDAQLHVLAEENARLATETAHLQDAVRRAQSDGAAQLAAKHAEIDTLENELSAQLLAIDGERRRLQDDCDRERDANAELVAEAVRLKECITSLELSSGELERDAGWLRMQNEGMQQDQVEVQELRMQIVHDQTELENLQAQSRDLVAAHEVEVAALRQQLAELDSLRTQIGQNQTDDQMCIQNENERLQARLAAMEAEVAQYQRQNLQLQMAGGGAEAVSFAVPEAEVPAPAEVATESPSSDSEKLLQSELISVDLQARLEQAENELQAVQARLAVYEGKAEMQSGDAERERSELVSLRRQIQEAQSADRAKEEQLRELREVIERIQGGEPSVEPVVVVRQQQVSAAGAPAAAATADEAAETALQRRNVAHLEQYINDLQIQLRIATNDCEQLAHTQHSLEEEIQQRSRGYEQQIDELRGQMLEQREQQQQQHQQRQEHQQQRQVQQHQPRQEQQQLTDESVLSSIESQIIPQATASTSTAAASSSAVPSFDGAMFFGYTTPGTSAGLFDSLTSPPPIAATSAVASVEPPIVQKTAYVCHDGGDADDGWGFGADEAALEEQHQQQQQQPSAAVQLRTVQCQLAEVQAEQERLRADNAAMQQKSAKMLRKLKEYKARNDELTEAAAAAQHAQRAGSAGSSDLDLAIQEELHSQIRSLETRLKEVRTEQDSGQLERAALLKRVDVLTSANERMTEMKERQDVDMEACRLRLRQVQQQLDQMHQWQDNDDDDGGAQVDAAKPAVAVAQLAATPVAVAANEPQLAELRRQCADLQTDNAELQAILDAEKELTASLEERLQRAGSSAATAADDSLRAANEHQQLTAQVAQLSARLAESVATIDTLSADSGTIRVHLDALRAEHQLKIEENSTLAQQFRAMADQLASMKSSLLDSRQSDGREAAQLEEQCEQLRATLQCREAEVDHLNGQLAAANGGRALVEQELAARREDIGALRQQVGELRQQIAELQQQREAEQVKDVVEPVVDPSPPQVDDQSVELHARIAQLAGELAALHDEKRSMEHELAVLNDQVINSLNLEDDMRAQRLQMDAKTIEIAELKGSLARLTQQQQQQQQQHETQTAHTTTVAELEAHAKQLNAHWEHVLEERCTALAESWRQHMAAREDEFAAQLARHPHVDETTQTSATSSPSPSIVSSAANTPAKRSEDSGALAADERTALADMQQALETQELEIVTLKEQLAIRSAEYARLAAQVDPFGSGRMTATTAATQRREPNQKSELDLCLYMLHQRDMRCEELTEELMSMLEERDSLQLKLAGTMRQMERLRVGAQDGSGGEAPSDVDSAEITPEKPHHAHNTSTDQSSPAPTTRHKTLRDEREQRHRQMAILQRDVATLPVEAVAELMGADYAEAAAAAQHAAGANAAAEAAAAVAAADESPYTALMNLFWGPRAPAPNES